MEVDSFEEYKRYLEESINDLGISKPPRVMSAYNLFNYERQLEGKLTGKKCGGEVGDEWKKLSDERREYYVKIYERRKREYNDLKNDYEILVNK
jgi:hypothetical protein